jgi:hypothetical protein
VQPANQPTIQLYPFPTKSLTPLVYTLLLLIITTIMIMIKYIPANRDCSLPRAILWVNALDMDYDKREYQYERHKHYYKAPVSCDRSSFAEQWYKYNLTYVIYFVFQSWHWDAYTLKHFTRYSTYLLCMAYILTLTVPQHAKKFRAFF